MHISFQHLMVLSVQEWVMVAWPKSIPVKDGVCGTGSVTLTVAATGRIVPHCITSPTQPRHVCPAQMPPVVVIVSDDFFTQQICATHTLPGHLHI